MDFSVMFFASLATGGTAAHYRLLLDAARLADAEGFAGVWTPERHFDAFGGVFPNPALSSAALAVATERLQLRAGSVISPLHDALVLAEDWSMVDNLSGGRAAVSFGSGWNPDDFVLNAGAYDSRRELMWEQIGLIQHLWRGGTIRRANGAGEPVEVALVPRPVQAELPLWITTGGTAETFARAGAAGANVLTHLITQDLAPLAEHVARYRSARAEAGHDPDAGCVTVMVHTFVGADDDEARAVATPPLRAYLRSALELDMKAARARDGGDGYDAELLEELLAVRLERYFGGLALLGGVEACVRVAGDLAAAGVDDLACLLDFGVEADAVLRSLERLCEVRRRCAAPAASPRQLPDRQLPDRKDPVMPTPQPRHELSLDFYDIDTLGEVVAGPLPLALGPEAEKLIAQGADYVASIAGEDRHIYGVNTGFGSLCVRRIPEGEQSELQHRHLLSHACGVGEPVSERIARLAVLIKLLTFRSGHCGIRLPTVQRMVELWNAGVVPAIPKKGTVGASGDLAPLAHMALPLIGEGRVFHEGALVEAPEALAALGLEPLRLGPKEGLALTNGVQYLNAIAVDCLLRARTLVRVADLVAALSMQGFSTARSFYQPLLGKTWQHPERVTVAENLHGLLAGSNHADLPHCNVAQEDPYSYRCVPQVHAAVRQAVGFARQVVERECNGVSDNPVFFPEEGQVLCAGNLHGASTAMVLDLLAISLTDLASISERRTYQLLSGQHGLPDYLVAEPGLDSGLMIPQYTAAALVNESKVLATPASTDTIATCQLQEDHVSMGGTSAYKLMQILDNCAYVLGIELLTAAQAIDLNEGLALSPATAPVVAEVREEIPHLARDRFQHPDIERARGLVAERAEGWCDRLGVR